MLKNLYSKYGNELATKRLEIIENLRKNGVIIPLDDGVIIDETAKIGAGTIISAGCIIGECCIVGENCELGYASTLNNSRLADSVKLHQCVNIENSELGENCEIYSNSYLKNMTLGNSCLIKSCYLTDSKLGNSVSIGPFSHIRPNCTLGNNVKIGDFVEIKNSKLDNSVHASHLTYIGDTDCGARVNFGCGVAIANFNGKEKFRTTIENDAFIGCNTCLVSPVKIGEGAYTAAGSVITSDVPENSIAIARAKAVVKPNLAKKYRREK